MIPDHISFRYAPDTLAPGALGQLILTYDPKRKNDLGYVSDEITLVTDEITGPQKSLMVISTIEEYFGELSEEELVEAPRLIFDKNSYDFQEVKEGSTAQVDFTLTNSGKTDLQIRTVKSNCECAVAKPEKNTIAPGESIIMQVNFDTSGRRGRQYKNITVFSNDPRAPTQVLSIKADINN